MKKLLLFKIATLILFLLSSSIFSQDTDGDGIANTIDLDNDNDGILDKHENNVLIFGGFEFLSVPSNGNNQSGQGVNNTTILPWKLIAGDLGSGGTPNIVKVDGGAYNYGNGGPPFDADSKTNFVGFKQHYMDFNGNADMYQTFSITATTNITYSAYFSPRDNNNTATGKISIYSGIGNNKSGATLIANTGTISVPLQNGSSSKTPWKLVQGIVTLEPGTYSYVVTMSNYSNVDECSIGVTNSNLDTDGDGVANMFDLDSDNDGIFDAEEAGHGQDYTNGVVNGNVGNDGIPDAVQVSANIGTVNYVIRESADDSDYIFNYLDLDSDGDGIPDNVEAQTTMGYVPPAGTVNPFGLDNNYVAGLIPVNTDGADNADYLDLNSDNQGGNDTAEAGLSLAGNDTDKDGLDDSTDATTGYSDVNGTINEPLSLPDSDGDANSGGDVDFRDYFDTINPTRATLYFNGIDDYLSRESLVAGLSEVTLMAWVKTDSGNSKDITIVGEEVSCRLWLKKGNIPMFTIQTRKNGIKTIGGCSNCNTIKFDEWHQITGTYSSTTGFIKIYVDGLLIDSYEVSQKGEPILASSYANGTFEIGRYSDKQKNNEYFKGNIDEVRVFDKGLTDSQIQGMVYQEIENNSENVKGTIVQKDITDMGSNNKVPWASLRAYYPMTDIKRYKSKQLQCPTKQL
jgi:hypothetical protein